MSTYAANTSVSVSQSQLEVERTLERYGATEFMRGWDQQRVVLAFVIAGRKIRFVVAMPDKAEFNYTETGKKRSSQNAINEAYEKACRQKWRALALVVKAKLEAVESGISTVEDEFMAFIQLPNGESVGEWMRPQLQVVYTTGNMPLLLTSGKESDHE